MTTLGTFMDQRWEEDRTTFDGLIEAGRIEWHCEGRHGVIRDVSAAEGARVHRALVYMFGDRCARRTQKRKDGSYDLEFVHMTKVYPPPNRPWGWCGDTVLFADWKAQEEMLDKRLENLRSQFKVGQSVEFDAKGKVHRGLVVGVNAKTIAVVEEGEGRWRVSPNLLRLASKERELEVRAWSVSGRGPTARALAEAAMSDEEDDE